MSKPKFFLSKSKVLQQYQQVNQIADLVSYSSKTNPQVTPILEQNTDCFFTLHFINELKNVQDKSRVIFLGQAWDEEQIQSLTQQGIHWFAVDNETDLGALLRFLENNDVKINLFLRLKLKENTLRTERHFVFGMPAETINKKIRTLKDHPKINHLGIHFHRKTQNMAEWNYNYEVFSLIDEDVLQAIDYLNIGGGLPANYANTNEKVLPTIINKIKEFKQEINQHNIKLIIEPGRFICASPVRLITTIIGIYDQNIIVNASVYNSDTDAFVVPTKLLVENELEKNEGKPYVIKGLTPCSMDLFRYRVYLDNPQVGDQLVFLNAGAYNFGTDFCDLDKIETEVVE